MNIQKKKNPFRKIYNKKNRIQNVSSLMKEHKNKHKSENINPEENNTCKKEDCQNDYPIHLNPFRKSNDNDEQLDNSEIEYSGRNDKDKKYLDEQIKIIKSKNSIVSYNDENLINKIEAKEEIEDDYPSHLNPFE